ncbi:hypothetical protein KAR91_49760 [Candidatus Pacearchaeota archaeon]|nr:hypothetical protein [Candidatus Pacearchaeota archaeon]
MEGFPQNGMLGQTGGESPEQEQQQAAMEHRNRVISQFMGTLQTVGIIDAGSSRGLLNGVLTEYVDKVIQSDGFKAIAKRIELARNIGEDRITINEEEVVQIDKELTDLPSPRMWISILTTLQYGVIPGNESENEFIVLW